MNFSMKNLAKGKIVTKTGDNKVGAIRDFAFSENRERDW